MRKAPFTTKDTTDTTVDTDRADVAVVGAGPAGALSAYHLARAGAKVLIIDPSHPREKPCGGGVTGRALAFVASVVDLHALPSILIRRASFLDHTTRRSVAVPLVDGGAGGLPSLLVASRREFDAALLGAAIAAGAVLVPERVVDVSTDGRTARVTTSTRAFHAGFLVGADGANSLVRRRLDRPFERSDLSVATGFFAHGAASDEIAIEFTTDPPGYIWSFPRPGHLAIGICAQADAGTGASELRARTRHWISALGIAPGATLQPYSWPIPTLPPAALDRLVLTGRNWCLAGDAAGLVDPITREGIFYALASGRMAAEAALGTPVRYAERVRDELVTELRIAATLKAGFFRPAFAALLLTALETSAPVRAIMADLLAGTQPYQGLRKRLYQTMEWRLAWKVLAMAGWGVRRR